MLTFSCHFSCESGGQDSRPDENHVIRRGQPGEARAAGAGLGRLHEAGDGRGHRLRRHLELGHQEAESVPGVPDLPWHLRPGGRPEAVQATREETQGLLPEWQGSALSQPPARGPSRAVPRHCEPWKRVSHFPFFRLNVFLCHRSVHLSIDLRRHFLKMLFSEMFLEYSRISVLSSINCVEFILLCHRISLIIFCKLLILFLFDLCSLIDSYFCFNLIIVTLLKMFSYQCQCIAHASFYLDVKLFNLDLNVFTPLDISVIYFPFPSGNPMLLWTQSNKSKGHSCYCSAQHWGLFILLDYCVCR